jgi:hypothetical protein
MISHSKAKRGLGNDGGCGLTRLYLNCRLIVGRLVMEV